MRRATGDRGWITIWVLGLTVLMLFIGGIALDLWRAFSERRALAAVADGAAVAGANGLDGAHFRATNDLRLDPGLAEQLAADNLASQLDTRSLADADVSATTDDVAVTVSGTVPFTLLRIFMGGEEFEVTVRSTAEPRRSP